MITTLCFLILKVIYTWITPVNNIALTMVGGLIGAMCLLLALLQDIGIVYFIAKRVK